MTSLYSHVNIPSYNIQGSLPRELRPRAPGIPVNRIPFHLRDAFVARVAGSWNPEYRMSQAPHQDSDIWTTGRAPQDASESPNARKSLATVAGRLDQAASLRDRVPEMYPTLSGSQSCCQSSLSPFTSAEPADLFPQSEGPPVVNLPRERTAELESDIAATKERVAAAEKIVVTRLHCVNDKLEQLRHRERVLDARSSSGNVHTHPQRYSRPAQTSLPRAEPTRARPLLHVFGDSFVGPFTLYQPAEVRVTKYKGASAQGLGNPHSALQVGPDVAHRLREYITAPGTRSKSALLMFGSVDLHINHLHHVTTKSIARHLPPEQRKQSMIPFAEHAMTGVEYAQKAFESYRRFLLNDIVRSETGDFVRDHAYNPNAPRILVAAAAPPMVEDQFLEAIRLKYILPHQSKPKDWAEKEPSLSSTPPSSPVNSRASTPSSSCSSLPTSVSSTIDAPRSVRAIVEHDLGLLDLASRIQATRHFNSELRSFCRQHPDVLHFVDITPSMVLQEMTRSGAESTVVYDVDRLRFGDKADPTNVHVDWEATLPLWEEELSWAGVPVEQFKYRTSLEETARAFSAEKSERVKRRSWRLETDIIAEREQKLGKVEVEKVEVEETHAPMVDKMRASGMPELVQKETYDPPPAQAATAEDDEAQAYGLPKRAFVFDAEEWNLDAARGTVRRSAEHALRPCSIELDHAWGW